MRKILGILVVAVVVAAVLMVLPQLTHFAIAMGGTFLVWYVLVMVFFIIVFAFLVKGIRRMKDRWGSDKGYMPAVLFVTGSLIWFIGGIYYQWGNETVDISLHDTYYVLAKSLVMYGMAIFLGLVAGGYYVFSGSFDRRPLRIVGYVHFWVSFVGCYLLLWRGMASGLAGMPRRYSAFIDWDSFNVYLQWTSMELLAVGIMQVVFVGVMVYVLSKRFFMR